MQIPAAVESVGDSGGQSENQFAVSESPSLGAAASSWAASSWELETVKAWGRVSLQSLRMSHWKLLLSPLSGWATLTEKQKKWHVGLEDNTSYYAQE